MKLIFIALLSTVLLNLAYSKYVKLNEQFVLRLWDQFKEEHEKEYISSEIENDRFEIFEKNVAIIEKHNYEFAIGIHTYTLGINYFADWTSSEYREYLLGYRSNREHKDQATHKFPKVLQGIQLPDTVDWRREGAVTGVKNQGRCGSCWAFSTTGSLEGAYFLATGKLVSLSEQQLVDCSGKYGNEGCNGGLVDNAITYIINNGGLNTENKYPYDGIQKKCRYKSSNIGAKCSGLVNVKSGDEEALKQAVALRGPVSVAIDASQNSFQLYSSGVYIENSCGNQTDNLDHAVLAVGYGTDSKTNLDYWLIKNSWDVTWGEYGYIRMARNKNNMCGVATDATYPVV